MDEKVAPLPLHHTGTHSSARAYGRSENLEGGIGGGHNLPPLIEKGLK
jgi:hypothetical protein